MWDAGVHTRFGKRIDFEGHHPSHKDISDEYMREITDKIVRTERDYTTQKEQEK